MSNKFASAIDRAKTYASKLADSSISSQDAFSLSDLWQMHDMFIVSCLKSGLLVINQNLAHLRVLYEQALCFDSNPTSSQALLFPQKANLSDEHFSILIDTLPFLEKMGFRMIQSEAKSITIDGIPSEMLWGDEVSILKNILRIYPSIKLKSNSNHEAVALSYAKSIAIKEGAILSPEEMRELVNKLFGTSDPYFSPDEKRIIIKLTKNELENKFLEH